MTSAIDLDVNKRIQLFRDKFWPNTPYENNEIYHEIFHKGKSCGYVMTQLVHWSIVPHIRIKKRHRTRECIQHIVKVFQEKYLPEFRRRGYVDAVTTCDITDTKTRGLLETLGFNTTTVCVGRISIPAAE